MPLNEGNEVYVGTNLIFFHLKEFSTKLKSTIQLLEKGWFSKEIVT